MPVTSRSVAFVLGLYEYYYKWPRTRWLGMMEIRSMSGGQNSGIKVPAGLRSLRGFSGRMGPLPLPSVWRLLATVPGLWRRPQSSGAGSSRFFWLHCHITFSAWQISVSQKNALVFKCLFFKKSTNNGNNNSIVLSIHRIFLDYLRGGFVQILIFCFICCKYGKLSN